MQARFQTEEYLSTHLNRTINEVVVEYTPNVEIKRPRVDHTYDSMPGMKKTFLFMPIREGVTLTRRYACWCMPCMQAWAPGEGTMTSTYCCQGCKSPALMWEETAIGRTDVAGISNNKQRSLAKARELTRQLQAHFEKSDQPLWVGVQNRGEDDPDQYWIGRASRIIKVYKEGGSVVGSGGRVRYDKEDCEIAVEWFQRDVSGGDERRTFIKWKRVVDADGNVVEAGPVEGHEYSFNSTELRLISNPSTAAGSAGDAVRLEMQALPPVGGAPLNEVQRGATRSSGRIAGQPHPNYRNVVFQKTTTRADPPEQLWEISTGSERAVLDNCW